MVASLLQGRDFLLRNGQWVIGNGETIRIWKDKWLPGNVFNPNQAEDREDTVNSLIDPIAKKWDLVKLRSCLPPQLAFQACQLPISYTSSQDKFLWLYTKDAQCSVKTGYHIAHKELIIQPEASSSHHQLPASFWNRIWNIKLHKR